METKNHGEEKCTSGIVRKQREKKENVVSEIFTDYCTSTSIHGIGYLGAKDKNKTEKVWWIIVVLISIICCSYLISRTWIKWKNNPVILSFEQEQTAVWQIPFPAVTICPLNKVKQTVYNYTEEFWERKELEGDRYKKFCDVSLICNLEQYDNIPMNCSFNITDENAVHNILSVAPDMNHTFSLVHWQGKNYTARDLFAEELTQEGLCFTFNSFSQRDMYTNILNPNIVYINHDTDNTGWQLENGYLHDSITSSDHPRRTAKDGSGSGLRVLLYNFNFDSDYICGPTISGYKVILHNPAETPRPTQQYMLFPTNKQGVVTVTPELTTTSENLRSMKPSVRKCYFSNEKYLKYFKVYTQTNCQTECAVNVTQHICGCIPFYMPSDRKTSICGFSKMDCVNQAEGEMLEFEMVERGKNASRQVKQTEAYKIYDSCDCLPSCSNLQFSAETSQTEIHVIKSFIATGLADELDAEIIEALESGIMTYTQIDIFYKDSQFLALHRSELYGPTDFLANCGGLLGLFMGFSFLSLIEIFYFSTIRLWIKCRKRANMPS